jgi:hypothetical protein
MCGADRGTSWVVSSQIARCASICMRQVLAVDEEAHRASARPTCEAAVAVARCIQKIAPCFTFASEYAQNYDASRKRLEVPNVVRAECLSNDNKMIVLCRNADGRIGVSTSSSPVARGSRSARRSRTRLSCSCLRSGHVHDVAGDRRARPDFADDRARAALPSVPRPAGGHATVCPRTRRCVLPDGVCLGLYMRHARPSIGWRAATSAPQPPCGMHWAPSAPCWTRPTKGSASSRLNAAYPSPRPDRARGLSAVFWWTARRRARPRRPSCNAERIRCMQQY